jgi:hypothetical protein
MKFKNLLLPALGAMFLVGCEANGVGGILTGPPPGSVGDTTNCEVVVANLCVLGGDDRAGEGLADILLAADGPLGPIAGAIDKDALVDALETLLANDDGDLVTLLQNLTAGEQLQAGLTELLLGENGDGMGALAETLVSLLAGNDEGQGLMAIIGADGGGAVGLLQALLLDGSDASCQAPLGTLCLIAGDGSQAGLVDLLLTSEGLAGSLSTTLTEEATDELVATLGNLLASNGALADLVQGLFQDGQLVQGLQVLLMGDPDNNQLPGLVGFLEGAGFNLPAILGEIGISLGGLFTPP